MAEIRSGRDGRDWTTLPNRGTAVTAGPPHLASQLSTDNGPARGGGRDNERFENTSIYVSSAETRVWQNQNMHQGTHTAGVIKAAIRPVVFSAHGAEAGLRVAEVEHRLRSNSSNRRGSRDTRSGKVNMRE